MYKKLSKEEEAIIRRSVSSDTASTKTKIGSLLTLAIILFVMIVLAYFFLR